MQCRYAGDVGDYIKLAILRAIMPGQRLGVCWWRHPDENHNGDGRHVTYLQQPQKWRPLDPDLFDGLAKIVESGIRCIQALQRAEFLPDTVFHGELIPIQGRPAERMVARQEWFHRVMSSMHDRDLVFIDPDNGMETSAGDKKSGKRVRIKELIDLSDPGRNLVVYHHHTRRKGGNLAELVGWADRLRSEGFQTVDAIRAPRYSPRAFLLLNATLGVREKAKRLAGQWPELLSWHPDAHVLDAEVRNPGGTAAAGTMPPSRL